MDGVREWDVEWESVGICWQEEELRTLSRRCCSLSSHPKGNSPCPKFPLLLPAPFPHKIPPKRTKGYGGNYQRKKEHMEFWDLWGKTARCKTGMSLVGRGRGKIPKLQRFCAVLFWEWGIWRRDPGFGAGRDEAGPGLEVTVGTCGSWPVGTAFPWGKEPFGSWKHLNHGLILKNTLNICFPFFWFFFPGKDLTGYRSSLWWHRFHQHQQEKGIAMYCQKSRKMPGKGHYLKRKEEWGKAGKWK